MNKLMIQLCIPVTGKSYDMLIPRTISVGQATRLIITFFKGMTGGAYIPDEKAVLCSLEDGTIYNVNSSVGELHLKNGARLMLI